MKRIKIIADDKIPFLKGVFEKIADIQYYPGSEINNEIVKDADALVIRTRTSCNEKLLSGSSIRFIATATIGFDHIDTGYCKKNGIEWTNAPGCNSWSVEQYVLTALYELAGRKRINLQNTSIGIIGAGMVGSKVAAACELLGMKVLVNDPPRARKEGSDGFVNLEQIKQQADIITFHVPLNMEGVDRTYHLLDAGFLSGVKDNVIIINTSRGPVADQKALKDAIFSGKVSSVVLDVWEGEPFIDKEMLQLTDIGTAHIAGYSTDGKANGTKMAVRAVSAFFGLELNEWEPENIPPPENPLIAVDCSGNDRQEIIKEVLSQSYDINYDDEQLKKSPDEFENIRGNYPLRRESVAYSVRLINNPYPELEKILEDLGFSVLETNCFC